MNSVLDRHWKICFENELVDSLDDGWQLEDRWVSTTIAFDGRQDYSYKFLLYEGEITTVDILGRRRFGINDSED